MDLSLGLDFGTTNTVLARPSDHGGAVPLAFEHGDEVVSALRSVLCFWSDESVLKSPVEVEAGPWAIDHFIENPGDCRFIQSLKSFSASPLFGETRIYGKRFTFEDLLATFLRLLRAHAGSQMKSLPKRLVVGRPVQFAGSNPDPQLAVQRYRAAFAKFGVEDVRFVYEPVAAAFYFAQRLKESATVLVADFGGGTSDFSIMRFEADGTALHSKALAWSGVGVAGDTFDFHIIDKLISPELGKGSRYKSMSNELMLPNRFYTSFARWSEMSILKTSRDFRDLKRLQASCLEPERLQNFIDLVEQDLGYALYKAVSEAKARLSGQEQTPFEFVTDSIDLKFTLKRSDFETWIAADLRKMSGAVNQALQQAGLGAADIDRVFLTGGSSFVPAVRRMFEERFGVERIETGDELISIAHGLALIGARDDIDRWCAADSE
jgi:hypothetical chaperone protein